MTRLLTAFLLFSVVWSWPLALSPASSTVSLHFDQYPAAWLVHAAPSFRDGVSELSGWPEGEPLVRLDSFLFLGLAFVLNGVLPGLLVTNLFVLLGPPLSAWGAARLAREVAGVGVVGQAVAGLAFGFAPLATVGVLEGHVYYLLDPWLPLCLLHTWRACGPGGRRDDLLAVVYWALSLLTTAYMGINASLGVAAIVAWRFVVSRRPSSKHAAAPAPESPLRLPWLALAGMAATGAAYAALFLAGSARTGLHAASDSSDALVRLGSASATTLIAWAPWMDLNRHSLAPAIGAGTLALALLAWPIRAPKSGFWLALGLGATALALGPVLELGIARTESWPTPLYPLLSLGLFDVYRFPIRFGWLAMIGLGVAAAVVAERLRWPWVAVGIAAVDALILSGGWLRVREHPSPAPSVYRSLPQAAVLDLYPEVGGLQEDMGFYFQNLSCYYQLSHRRPILDRCLNTNLAQSPRLAASRAVHAAVLGERPVLPVLEPLRVGGVVLHAGLYQPSERAMMITGLSAELGPPGAEGADGGEWLLGWAVPTHTREEP